MPQPLNAPAITLYAPGLWGRAGWPERPPAVLTKALSRARRQAWAVEGYTARALALLDLPADAGLAALARLGEGRGPDDRWWVRCDPVHLAADGDRLLLLDNETVTLDTRDAARLGGLVAEVFAADGGVIEIAAPARWYLSLAAPEPLQASDMAEVAGRNIRDFLPGGNARYWRTRLNEAQMVLHEALVGRHGGEASRGEVNSVWLWGPGYAPKVRGAARPRVFSDDVLMTGMARAAQASVAALPAGPADLDLTQSSLIVLRGAQGPVQYGDTGAWLAFLETFVAVWWGPLAAAARAGRLGRLSLIGDRGPVHTVEPGRWRTLARRWRR